jgi:hypothetical protein
LADAPGNRVTTALGTRGGARQLHLRPRPCPAVPILAVVRLQEFELLFQVHEILSPLGRV